MGAVGCGIASLVVYWALFLMAWAYVHLDPGYRRFAIRLARPRGRALAEHLRLGVPIGLSYALESTSFTFMALLIARLGTSVTGGHQIISNLGALAYQIPLALSLATATVTAQAIGGGDLGAGAPGRVQRHPRGRGGGVHHGAHVLGVPPGDRRRCTRTTLRWRVSRCR